MKNLNLRSTSQNSAREKQVLHLIAHLRKTAGLMQVVVETGIYNIKNKAAVASFVMTILMLCCTFSASIAQSGRTCGQDVIHEHLMKTDPTYLENRRRIEERTQEILASGREQNGSVITIPIVFHIFHNGDAVGSGENLSVALIQAQLDQLNDDFRRNNSDVGNTPPDFAGLAADTEIEFCLAEFDPNGAPTTGINRYNINDYGGDESQCWNQSYLTPNFVAPTIWDRDLYLNYYSFVKVNGTTQNNPCAGLLGYATFPGASANRDAVVCVYSSLGSIATPNPAGGAYGKGRTGTHEVGHWLNLSHIWGNSSTCAADDGVADTHPHGAPNYTGAPCTYPGPNTCGAGTTGDLPDMFQNYMDYSTDDCMNLFTTGQKDRMLAAITASRPGLLTSPCGCSDAITVTSTADSGVGSLREAVARLCPGGNIFIDVAAPIVLATPIEITEPGFATNLENAGTNPTIISGGGTVNLFNVTNNAYLAMYNINLTEGNPAVKINQGRIFTNKCNFYNNVVTGCGAAISATDAGIFLLESAIYDNSSACGTGVKLTNSVSNRGFTLYNCTFVNNSAVSGFGGALDLYFQNGTLGIFVNSSTFHSNSATGSGQAIWLENPAHPMQMKNSIVYDNGSGAEVVMAGGGTALSSFGGNVFQEAPAGVGVDDIVGQDPAFGNLVSENNRNNKVLEILPWGSAFDAGIDCNDIAGNPLVASGNGVARPTNDACDSGAYEHRTSTAGCDDILPLTCGASVGDNTGNLLYFSCDNTQTYSSIYEYTPLFSGNLNLSLHSFSGNQNLYLYDSDICGSSCDPLAFSTSDSDQTETIDYIVTAGTTYYVLVWAEDGTESSYSLDVICPEAPLLCDNKLSISCNEAVVNDLDTQYDFTDACGFFGFGGFQLYEFTPFVSGTVVVELYNLSDDKDLYIFTDACGEACEFFDSSTNSSSANELVTLVVTAGTTYDIVIYDWEQTGGQFSLSVECTDPCEEDIFLVSPDDDIPGAAFLFATNKSIYATNKITGVSAVDFSAGPDIGTGPTEAIHLNSGFEVGLGAVFHAYMDGCGILLRNEGATGSDGPKISKSFKK